MPAQTIESVFVALTHDDGSLSIMQFVTNDGRDINRLATSEAVDAEIVKTRKQSEEAAKQAGLAEPVFKSVRSWRFVSASDLPATRAGRDAWKDNGDRIVADRASKSRAAAVQGPRRARRK